MSLDDVGKGFPIPADYMRRQEAKREGLIKAQRGRYALEADTVANQRVLLLIDSVTSRLVATFKEDFSDVAGLCRDALNAKASA